jgi:hypothetical protein
MSTEKKAPKFVPTWTFTSTTLGQPASPFNVKCYEMTDALMWFHADRQINDGLTRDDYAIDEIVSDHTQKQHYDRYDLPPRNPDIRDCVFSKSLHNAHAEKLIKLGITVKVAA